MLLKENPRSLAALSYILFAAAGVTSFFFPSQLRDISGPVIYAIWQVFIAIGGLAAAVGVYSKVLHWEFLGIPLLFTGSALYAVGLGMFALESGRGTGWALALILAAVAANMGRRWVYVYMQATRRSMYSE